MAKADCRGKFVCIEGVDGCGKTTQARLLVKNLVRRGFDAVYTTEPSAGTVGELILSFVLAREERISVALEALLFAADRVDHVKTEVEPWLKQGKVVVCDRYVYSSLAYQGAAGLDTDWIDCINRFALKPDVALLLDVPSEVVISRLKTKKSVMENMANLKKVRNLYVRLAEQKRMALLNGNRSIEEVADSVLSHVLKKLSN